MEVISNATPTTCRCEQCRAGYAAWMKLYRAAARQREAGQDNQRGDDKGQGSDQ